VASTGTTASTSGRSVSDPSQTSCVPLRPSRWLDRASVLIVNPAHPDSMRVQALPTLMGVSEDDSFSVVLECPLRGVNSKQSTGRHWTHCRRSSPAGSEQSNRKLSQKTSVGASERSSTSICALLADLRTAEPQENGPETLKRSTSLVCERQAAFQSGSNPTPAHAPASPDHNIESSCGLR
jgi:hypothetical protein